jgi:hypothetical protein
MAKVYYGIPSSAIVWQHKSSSSAGATLIGPPEMAVALQHRKVLTKRIVTKRPFFSGRLCHLTWYRFRCCRLYSYRLRR